ncbi:N-(5'-phosphoribosyl)anthranilate isomerase [Clostridium novyi B str. ATCC 27606]|uniref:N-(5'-phosphoribosyl)anthranilate isomerase n=2 Tax=Clostridium TaxID=1485 RepID=A0AA40ISJ4_CLONO|nr:MULTISPECIES: phosphoribosylanthranilate isomerase [Clostridium]KEI11514.1 N-(5'-phosphoribosyl)anthranilate isomerase [Clostridium novyi B str. NCTC 9691]KEI13456.1 N-(5'-phosphoribosyl)anthranilate isomerase [Clostridium novyi B str. ATCC 27606]KEI16785.1 N-(5'-phosphoribosyl)anthranilate isomerase [Clostridium haemolyticum NCTC 9693]KGN01820.1 N-(5'-phosphoribosyl)anthranilate isomerase [Clostridium haemolyticum NCTC 8350]
MIKQIYSIIKFHEAVETMDAGADNIGLVPMQNAGIPAHRVPLDVVEQIFTEARKRGVTCVSIALSNIPEEIIEIAKESKPDILHVSGDKYAVTKEFAEEFRRQCPGIKLMQAVSVRGKESIDEAILYSKYVDYIILDTGLAADTGIGASGRTHDWNISEEIVKVVNIPVILAGGLGVDNVEAAIRKVKPYGVDSLTKTSIMGGNGHMRKDIAKVKEFCEIADRVGNELGL